MHLMRQQFKQANIRQTEKKNEKREWLIECKHEAESSKEHKSQGCNFFSRAENMMSLMFAGVLPLNLKSACDVSKILFNHTKQI